MARGIPGRDADGHAERLSQLHGRCVQLPAAVGALHHLRPILLAAVAADARVHPVILPASGPRVRIPLDPLACLAVVSANRFTHQNTGGREPMRIRSILALAVGVVIALAPWLGLVLVCVWLLTVAVTRISSLGALVSFLCLPPLALFFRRGDKALLALAVFLTALLFIKHVANIKRLARGEEPVVFPAETMLGSLLRYISTKKENGDCTGARSCGGEATCSQRCARFARSSCRRQRRGSAWAARS